MPPENKSLKSAGKDDSTSRKTTSGRSQPPALKCPRCDSPNTKFCYYNNYSLSQPRHFCKTCRRYWTKGGAMRSVPIGGGCRKNKKARSSSGDSVDSNGSSTDIGGLKFFQGISPAMDFQLGGISAPFPRIPDASLFNKFSSGFGNLSNTSSALPSSPCYTFDPSAKNSSPVTGFNFPFSSTIKQGNSIPAFQEIGSSNLQNNLASSIESLSSINQDLHWKLQKQRLSMLLVGDNQKGMNNSLQSIEPNVEKPQPILFQNLEIPKADQSCGIKTAGGKDGGIGNVATEWFFDNPYANMSQTPATSGNNVDENNNSSWSGIQAWNDLSHYSSIP
ncbi:hypothetical protein ACS0TY_008838 [Phlomoides rotata]